MAVPKYQMTLSLSVIDHLGFNLYSSTPAVLSEVVANAWDADAEHVDIVFKKDRITISDDGAGMTISEINDRFLTVGYRRREHQPVRTPKHKRHVMGRKGIGKLSLFAIADTIKVETAKNFSGSLERNGFVMHASKIRAAATANKTYAPRAVPLSSIKLKKGTQITISDLNTRASALTERALRTRLARRFSILGPDNDFTVSINGKEIGPEDRDYFSKIEFLWSIGDVGDKYEKATTSAKQKKRLNGDINKRKGHTVTGWVGTVDERKSIEEINNTVVMCSPPALTGQAACFCSCS